MIQTENLGRYFDQIKAVDGISFSVSKGEVLGFLGPNGAGKSTTMKLLTCFLSPSFGSAKVGGFDIVTQSREVRKLIGYLPENAPLYGEMTVRSFLEFIAQVRGVKEESLAVGRVLELASLGSVAEQRIETLSKGFRRRVGLAQSLIHDPEILILDEPTDGLDPNQKHEVRELIRGMAKEKCIILSTHILEEVDEVCTRAVIIARGKIVADDTPDRLRGQSEMCGAVTVAFGKDLDDSAVAALRSIPGVRSVREVRSGAGRRSFVLLPNKSSAILPAVMKEAEQRSWPIQDLRLDAGQLDEVFRAITQ
ncbi:MAG: ATP-binding cassette domain-containing protein [Bdellovibrionota bacterium]